MCDLIHLHARFYRLDRMGHFLGTFVQGKDINEWWYERLSGFNE